MGNLKIFIKKLLPTGIYWEGKNFLKLIDGIAQAFSDVLKFCDDILLETFPLTAKQTIKEWESLLEIITNENDLEKRRFTIAAKLAATGGNTYEYFLILAKAFDSQATILRFKGKDFRAGKSRVGEPLGHGKNERFKVIFMFSNSDNKNTIIQTLEYNKTAHIEFIYKFRG
jgi:uncharacterized protein YmfQ (DUF2313 family)